MLKSAKFADFTCVPNDTWVFSPGLNVIVGENGLGKSHVLKAIYSVLKAIGVGDNGARDSGSATPSKTVLEQSIANELMQNMRPDRLGRLVKRHQGSSQAKIGLVFDSKVMNVEFTLATRSTTAVKLSKTPEEPVHKSPVFIPTRELITLCPWFASLYDNSHVPFEKSWRDTVSLLGTPAIRGPREKKIREITQPIEKAMGGNVEVDENGRFFLKTGDGYFEAALVAEGLRKFAMLARLVSTGVLLEQGYLLWDEPETNMNPKLIKTLAGVVTSLAQQGIQVFIATHSLFLLREISIINKNTDDETRPRYFSLVSSGDDEVSRLEQGDTPEDIKTLLLLDEELEQSQRYMDAQDHD